MIIPDPDSGARLRDAERRLADTQALTDTGSWELDLVTGTLWWSEQTWRIFEIADAQTAASYERFLALVHPDDRELVDRAYSESVASRTPYAVEHRLLMPDGRVKHLRESGRTFYDGDRPVRSVGSVQNVTVPHAVQESMRLKDQAIAAAVSPIAFTDGVGRVIAVNPAFVRAWGYGSEAEVLGLLPTDLAESSATADMLQQVRTAGSFQGELVARRKDSSTFEVLLSAHAVRDERGGIVNIMASFLDVSESKRLQARLAQAEKLQSVGRLAGGVAHDFNNLLTVIGGFTEMSMAGLEAADPRHEAMAHVVTATQSASRLTQQLLAFSRKQVIRPEVLDMNEVLTSLEPLLRRLVGEDLDVQFFRHARPVLITFDRGQCEQILVNLVANARDAMPQGGRLTIECGLVTLDDDYCRAHKDVAPGEFALLAVSDTGVGLDAVARAHLFEPFFTTKGVGRGTGLGLPMVFGAVSQNRGRIEVYSEEGHGTTIKIFVPVSQDAPVSAVDHRPAADQASGGETLLLVEDNPDVRLLTVRALTRRGYRVLVGGSAEEALATLDAFDGEIALLVTDVVLPGTNGRILAERVLARRPGTPVLFTSGYTANVIVHHGVLYEGVRFLQKPYSLTDLWQNVRDAIDARRR